MLNKKFFYALLLSCLMCLGGLNSLQAQAKKSVLVKNTTVITVTNGTYANTDLLVVDGKIKEIGKSLKAPRGAEVIDGEGKFVMPGIIDAHSHIAISGGVNEPTTPVSAMVSMEDVINPNDVNIYRALAGGVTTIHALHGSANVIGGQAETVKLRYGVSQDEMKLDGAPRTIKFALGENPTRVHGIGTGIQPRSRMGVEQVIRSNFDAALDYRRKREAYLSAKAEFEKTNKGFAPVPVAKDLRKEVLADIVAGKVLVHCHSYRADEIHMLMRVFKDYGVKNYTFQHANEAFKVAPELAANGAHASVFSDWWAYKFEVYYSTAYNAAILNKYGVVTSIKSDSGELIRHLNHEASKVMRYGKVSEEDALKMITINPATQLGVQDRIGSLEVGKDGDFAIWSAHPLSIYARCEKTFVDGNKYFDMDDQPDQRLTVSPSAEYDAASEKTAAGREVDACMQDVFYFFGQENALESRSMGNHNTHIHH